MDKHFICLANSYKRGGRCIAGIVVSIDSNDHWVTETLSNGSPKWIRPINRNTEYGEIPENEARFISLLSIVRLTDIEPCPSQSHAEDVYYQQILAVGIIQPTTEILDQLTDKVHADIFYNRELAISPEEYHRGDYSLMMIHPEFFEFQEDPSKNRAKYRLKFLYHNVYYDFSVTDPDFYELITQKPDLIKSLKDFYLVLSIGLVYEGRHHKLIAGIIIPPTIQTGINPHTIIDPSSVRKISSRKFSLSERWSCKKAFVVPSQQGMSVCIKKKNGEEVFYIMESSCNANPWQIINLRKVILNTYRNPLGRESLRLSIPPSRSYFIQIVKKIYLYLVQ